MEQLILTHNSKIALFSIYACVFFIMAFIKFMQVVFKKDMENIWIRMKSFVFILLFFTCAFAFNELLGFLFLILISYLGLKEFFSLIPTRKTDRIVLFWAYLSIPVSYYIIYTRWITMFYIFVPLYMFLLTATRMVIAGNTQGFLKNLAVIQYGLMINVYALGYLGMIMIIPFQDNPQAGSVGLLFYILVLTVSNDFMQYFSGKMFGKHKIIPNVSPNKTWEGFLGGIIGTTILSVFMAHYLTPFTIIQSAFAGVVLAIAGFFGDVTMSAIKRDLGVKDTSSLIPGHGGILDRLDSLLFTAPLFYHYFAYIYHISIPR